MDPNERRRIFSKQVILVYDFAAYYFNLKVTRSYCDTYIARAINIKALY